MKQNCHVAVNTLFYLKWMFSFKIRRKFCCNSKVPSVISQSRGAEYSTIRIHHHHHYHQYFSVITNKARVRETKAVYRDKRHLRDCNCDLSIPRKNPLSPRGPLG